MAQSTELSIQIPTLIKLRIGLLIEGLFYQVEGYGPSCDTDLKLDIGVESFILGPGLADQIRTLVRYRQGN